MERVDEAPCMLLVCSVASALQSIFKYGAIETLVGLTSDAFCAVEQPAMISKLKIINKFFIRFLTIKYIYKLNLLVL